MTTPLLRVVELHKHFREGRSTIHAVNGVSLEVYPGEAVGLVGESGCGKSTTARCILRLEEPTSGRIEFEGTDLAAIPRGRIRTRRKDFQMVFQDPNESLNPRFSIRRTLREPLKLHGLYAGEEQLTQAVQRVHLETDHLGRLPHQLSGGQKQRVGVARAMMTTPKLVILDEPTSSLDMSLRIHVIVLLKELQRELNLSYIYISHDLSTIRHLCGRVMVMYLGRIVEQGRTADVFDDPTHVYTKALLSAIPIPDPTVKRNRILLKGETPTARELVPGCALQGRCEFVLEECRRPVPEYDLGDGHRVACRLAREHPKYQPSPPGP
ncbi:MAG: ATP-binding cassette domain-containing protein [Anaerolineales bacterium]|nr:ATP-binding cassette domain-containing protein [Anaerolineales bacterium]